MIGAKSEKMLGRIIFCHEHYDQHIKMGGNSLRWHQFMPEKRPGFREAWECDYMFCDRVAVIVERKFDPRGVQL